MKKVLIVDKDFVHGSQSLLNKEVDFNLDKRVSQESYNGFVTDKVIQIREKGDLSETYDITQFYKDAGGREELELLVLGEPIVRLPNANVLSSELLKDKLSKASFGVDRAVKLIESIDPDVLLIDTKFPVYLTPSIKKEYMEKNNKKYSEESSFEFRPADTGGIEFPAESNFIHERNYDWIYRFDELKLTNSGGVILGKHLREKGRPFSFWTSLYQYGEEALVHAYVFDLLSKEDLRTFTESEKQAEKERYRKPFRGIPIVKSERGNIISDVFRVGFSGTGFDPKPRMNIFEEMIQVADNYQKNK